jgi:hypothetical protein
MRMKSWESPRRGRRRNHKSKPASARLRQLKKQRQQLHKKLKAHTNLQQKASGQQPEAFALRVGKHKHTQIIEGALSN